MTPRLGARGLLKVNAFWFGNGAHWQPIFGSLLPIGAVLLVGQARSPLLVARVTAAGGVFALLVPILVGHLSDRTRSRWGRRRPWMVGGTMCNVAALIFISVAWSPLLLVVGYLLIQASNNVAGAAYSAVIPDVVPASERGHASALLGVLNGVGTVAGVGVAALCFALLGGERADVNFQAEQRAAVVVSYAVLAILLSASLTISCWGLREPAIPVDSRAALRWFDAPTTTFVVLFAGFVVTVLLVLLLESAQQTPVFIVSALLGVASLLAGRRSNWIRALLHPLTNHDFFWVFTTRSLMQLGIFTMIPFIEDYFAEVVRATNPGATASAWLLALVAGGLLPALLSGRLSDRLGRRKIFVYVSGGLQAAVTCVLVFGLVSELPLLYLLGFLFGAGYGTYYGVDWALAIDVLPDRGAAGKDMGLWHVSLTLPQVVAPALLGGLVYALNQPGSVVLGVSTGNLLGFRALFVIAAVLFATGTVTVSRIKGVR